MPDALKEYKAKRNFSITSEPAEGGDASKGALTFVIQKHWATRLHYDFRLELDGTMKSWAVPKGPSFDSHDRRMAIHVEDHPISYSDFEGTIPPKQYGAGEVIVWDKGTWEPIGDPRKGYAKGEIKFEIHGHKMHGRWVLVRLRGHEDDRQEPWLLIKENDEYMRPASEFSVVDEMPDSVKDLPMPGAPEDRAAARAKVAELKAEAKKPAAKSAAKTAAAKTTAAKPVAKTTARRGAMPEGAVKAELPETLNAELATLVDAPPERPEEWIFEIKFDGYRMLTRVAKGGKDIRLITRNGNDWTDKLRPLQEEIRRMKLPDGWYDGEIVVHDENGKPNFNLLQLAFDGSNRAQIVYFIFDAPYMKGYDLREVRLDQRRPLLQEVLEARPSDTVRFSSEFGTDPSQLVVAACQIGLEGVIGKRRDSRYVNRRSPEWIKLKCGMRQEFVIGGYTDPHGARTGIGSLLLGYYDEQGVLRYAGNCGSGFNGASLRRMRETLEAIATDENPFPPRAVPGRGNHWVKPTLVAEVSFSEWTATNSIRHPVFQGLRKDKPARSVVREQAKHVQETATVKTEEQAADAKPAPRKRAGATSAKAAKAAPADSGLPATFKVTHGERVMDKESGVTKLELVEYYALVGELMMEHLKGRPVSLVRAPEGVGGELFFQKHVVDPRKMPGIGQLAQDLDPEHPRMTRIDSVEGILSCAQWNVVEIHSQNAVEKRYDTPDRFVFDLDPGEGISFAQVQEAAEVMRVFLQELGLNPFLKTSGGKGLHVVVPLKPKLDWDTVKDFSHAIVTHLAKTLPDRFSDKSGAKNRVGRIFIDYLRNGRGATTVSAWSARTRPGLGISVPVRWDELAGLTSGAHWTVRTVGERLAIGNTPWEDYADSAVSLTKAMKTLGFKAK